MEKVQNTLPPSRREAGLETVRKQAADNYSGTFDVDLIDLHSVHNFLTVAHVVLKEGNMGTVERMNEEEFRKTFDRTRREDEMEDTLHRNGGLSRIDGRDSLRLHVPIHERASWDRAVAER